MATPAPTPPPAPKRISIASGLGDILQAATPPQRVEPERESFGVSAQIIRKLSQQMYRSPANALKELISNAFDADADAVRIEATQRLDKITVIDSGKGMQADEFVSRMKSIAAEMKRKKEGQTTAKRRPMIGKLGVGLLAVGQICSKVSVISKEKGTTEGFLAKIDLEKFFKEEAAGQQVSDIESAIRLWKMAGIGATKESFTAIVLEDMRPTFLSEFLFNRPNFREGFVFDPEDKNSFEKFIAFCLQKKLNGERPAAFDDMVWELGLIAPVAYLDGGPIRGSKKKHPILDRIVARLAGWDFHVYVNDVEIRKPILFPNEPDAKEEGDDWNLYEFEFDEKADDDRTIKAEGYFYHQVFRIMPPELRGVLPRIREVGIGSYDRTLFGIPQVLGPVIMAQSSGEVYISEGLEQALNIDRNSFDMIDSGYQKLRELVLNELQPATPEGQEGPSILQDVRRRQKARRKRKKVAKATKFYASVTDVLKDEGYPGWSVQRFKSKRVAPVQVDADKKRIAIYDSDLFPQNVEAMSEDWRNILMVLIMRDVAHHLASPWSKQAEDDIFYRLLGSALR